MILVDTPVWVGFFRAGDKNLWALLEDGSAAIHDFVLGELACGNLRDRQRTLSDLSLLPRIDAATTDEVLFLIANHQLQGRGLGWIDAHLLAAARLAKVRLYTLNRTLAAAADDLGIYGK